MTSLYIAGEELPEQFAAMKESAFFVNTGRGPCHDEAALIDALERGEIAGAALDVFETEPVDLENPLLRMDNVIVTPHIASATSRMMPETRRRLGEELAAALRQRPEHSLQIRKIPAHTTVVEIGTVIPARDRSLNDGADRLAKAGAWDEHKVPADVVFRARARKLRRVLGQALG